MACGGAPHHWSWATVAHTELIIGIRDVHSEVSAWTSRTTLSGGQRSRPPARRRFPFDTWLERYCKVWWQRKRKWRSVYSLTRSTFTVLRRSWKHCNTASCKMPSRSFQTVESEVSGYDNYHLRRLCMRLATYRRWPRPTSGCPDSIRRERRRRSPASPHSVPRC